LISGLLGVFTCVCAYPQSFKPFPGDPLDERTRYTQEQVENVYVSGDYERALLIYEKELAPIGDKYAQYMVGYMHLNAQGTEQNRAEALAWFRLAAERGEPLLGQIRDEVTAMLTPAERSTAEAVFLDLWKEMGDRALLVELIERDMRTLRGQTGTRIPGGSISSPAIVMKPSGETAGPDFYRDARMRLKARIDYLDARVEIDDDALAEQLENFRGQEEAIKDELAAIENR